MIMKVGLIIIGRGGANWGWCEWSNQSCGGRVCAPRLPIIKPFPMMRNLKIFSKKSKKIILIKKGSVQ